VDLADVFPADVIPVIFGFAGFRLGFKTGLAPTMSPVVDGNHCRLFNAILPGYRKPSPQTK
jgi:hypothetical protein